MKSGLGADNRETDRSREKDRPKQRDEPLSGGVMISAMESGTGKTVMSCALMLALKRCGLKVRAYKAGPDYLDPMYHSAVLEEPARNLDLFLQGEEGVKRSFAKAKGHLAVLEGAMGFYDGVGGSDRASAWDLARLLELPVLLVVKPGGSSLTLAAQLEGLLRFREESRICGYLLSRCREARAEKLTAMLERETGLPVLGWLPPMEEAVWESRHLGLFRPEEIENLKSRAEKLAERLEENADLDRILAIARSAGDPGDRATGTRTGSGFEMDEAPDERLSDQHRDKSEGTGIETILPEAQAPCRVAVAADEAFCFRYEDSLDALRDAGAEILFFSPLRDETLPQNTDGLWLPGGYPELYAGALSENGSMRESIRQAVEKGLPTIAECGGFLYLQERLRDRDGNSRPMCGVLPGEGYPTGSLQRFGYVSLSTERDSLLFRSGESIPCHEFHHWDSDFCGTDLEAVGSDGRTRRCAVTGESLYAGFPHLHLAGEAPMAERFIAACRRRKAVCESRGSGILIAKD